MTKLKTISNTEKLKMAKNLLSRFSQTIKELNPNFYNSSDLILYGDDMEQLIDNKIAPEFLEDRIKNLRLFTEENKNKKHDDNKEEQCQQCKKQVKNSRRGGWQVRHVDCESQHYLKIK